MKKTKNDIMKTILQTIMTFTFLVGSNTIFAQELEWAKSFAGTEALYSKSIAIDNWGNVFTTGYFSGTVDFDPGAGTHNLTSHGAFDIFISKLNSNGDFVWVKQIGSSVNEAGEAITVDDLGNIIVTGYYGGNTDFDPGVGTNVHTPIGFFDIFILKLDLNGDLIWVRSFGSVSDDRANSVAVDATGNIYTTGVFTGTVDFDPSAGTTNLISVGSKDVFVHKMDADGNLMWAKSFGSTTVDGGNSIFVDLLGNVYTTGFFQETVDFDPGATTHNITSAGGNDVFVQKLDASGNFEWVKSFGASGSDRGLSLAVDQLENVFVTGGFYNTVDFDPGVGTFNLTSNGLTDIFLSKLDASGNFVWTKSFGGPSHDLGFTLVLDEADNIYSAGYFSSTVDFDPNAGIQDEVSIGPSDIYIHKMDEAGNFSWVETFGSAGISGSLVYSIAIDNSLNVHSTGYFENTVDFDPGVGTTNLTSAGDIDAFVHKMSQCNGIESTDVQTACGSYTWIDNNIYTTSNNTATYTFINGAVNGCDSTVTLNLTLNPLPTVSISTFSNDTICDNSGIVSLPVGSPSGGVYSGTGVTGGNFDPQISGVGTFDITYTYTNEFNCTSSDMTQITVEGCLGFNQNDTDPFKISPNPFRNTIHVSNLKNGSSVSLLDMKGKLVFEQTSNTTSLTINSENLECGVYFLQVIADNQITTKKVIKH